MSHLPPRPDFADHPSRSDSRPHYHGRPAPMAPEHVYPPHPRDRERERDVYMAGRSPPRPKHPPSRLPDSYISSDRERDRDSYVPRDSREPPYPPPPPYDRREYDSRHRDSYRERGWDRRDYRDYPPPPPPHAEYRYREPDPRTYSREPRDVRDRGRPSWDDGRVSSTRGSRKSPPRSWTQSDEIDRHPRGNRPREPNRDEDRRWQTRPGQSPPRRYASKPSSPPPSTSGRRPRSPLSPGQRTPSPSPSFSRPSRPASPPQRPSRVTPPREGPELKLGNHSIAVSPRRPAHSSRREDYSTRRDRRSRSRSPIRSPRPRRSRSPIRITGISSRDRRSQSRSYSPRRRGRTRSPPRKETVQSKANPEPKTQDAKFELSRPRSQDLIPASSHQPPPQPTSTSKATVIVEQDQNLPEPLPALRVDAPSLRTLEKSKEQPSVINRGSPKAPSTGSVTPLQSNVDTHSLSRPRSPWSIAKASSTPKSPQGRSPLSALQTKPEWGTGTTTQTIAAVTTTPTLPSAEPPKESVEDTINTIKRELAEKWRLEEPWYDPTGWRDALEEFTRTKLHQRYLETNYSTAAEDVRKAWLELEMTNVELDSLNKKRELTMRQLKLAEDGIPGAEWPGAQELEDVQA